MTTVLVLAALALWAGVTAVLLAGTCRSQERRPARRATPPQPVPAPEDIH